MVQARCFTWNIKVPNLAIVHPCSGRKRWFGTEPGLNPQERDDANAPRRVLGPEWKLAGDDYISPSATIFAWG